MRGLWRTHRGLFALQGLTWICGGFGVAGQWVMHEFTTPTTRPMPVLADVPYGLAFVALALPLVLLAWLVIAPRFTGSRARRYGLGALAVLLQLVASSTAAALVLVTDPDFPLGPSYVDSTELPDGDTAYLYRTPLFCGYDIYRRREGGTMLEKVGSVDRKHCTGREQHRPAWDPERREIIVVDEHGNPVPSEYRDWSGLYWGPH